MHAEKAAALRETTLSLWGTSCLGCAGMGRKLTCELQLMLAALAWRNKHLLNLWSPWDGSPKPGLAVSAQAMQRLLEDYAVQSRGCGRTPVKRLALAGTVLKHPAQGGTTN